jgi:hypothetical protein
LTGATVVITAVLWVAGPAWASNFVGDLVYCDLNANGVWESGEPPLNGVVVDLTCADPDGIVCFEGATTTGTLHPSAELAIDLFDLRCGDAATFDPTDPAKLDGRYLFEVAGNPEDGTGCFFGSIPGGFERPWSCAVRVDPATLPANCDGLVTPREGGFPIDANIDGDHCDDVDGPFPEGQVLGNLPNQGTCEAFPDPAPESGAFSPSFEQTFPLEQDRCSIHNDFGYTRAPEAGPSRTPGFWKNHPGAVDNFLPLDFCGETIAEACRAAELLDTGGGGLNQFIRHGLAALLNCAAYGCSSEIADLIDAGSDACAMSDGSFDYGAAGTLLDLFNNSGNDIGTNPPGFNTDKRRCKEKSS